MRERITDDDDEKEKDDDVPGNFFCFVCFGDVPFFFTERSTQPNTSRRRLFRLSRRRSRGLCE